MSADQKRTAVLLGALAVVALLVAVDRFTGSGDDAGAPALDTPRQRYLAQARLAAETRALTEQADEWADLRDAAEDAWARRRARVIDAPSAEIASARLRDLVQVAMEDAGLRLESSSAVAVGRPAEDLPLRIIGLSLSFQARDVETVHRLVDRLENLPEVVTNIESLSLRGPGRVGAATGVEVSLTLRAPAWIEREAPRG